MEKIKVKYFTIKPPDDSFMEEYESSSDDED